MVNMQATMHRWRLIVLVTLPILAVVGLVKRNSDTVVRALDGVSEAWRACAGRQLISSSVSSFDDAIRSLWEPLKIAIEQSAFLDQEGSMHELPETCIWTKQLGMRVCIMDTDTRPMDGSGQILNRDPLKWNNLDRHSAGMLSHYLYAKIHGYDYQMLRSPTWDDRANSWVKVLMTREALKTHDIVVFVDSDVSFVNLELPIEWLMNYWEIRKNTTIAMASDPALERDADERGNPELNTGLLIIQNIPQTWALYDAWAGCPSERRYKGCSTWSQTRQREQAAFSNYIRYDPEFAPNIQVLPCMDANGYPERFKETKCNGTFVRHYWLDKQLVKDTFAGQILSMMAPTVHRDFVERWNETVVDLRNKHAVGVELLDENS